MAVGERGVHGCIHYMFQRNLEHAAVDTHLKTHVSDVSMDINKPGT